MKSLLNIKKNESGEIMIESVLVYTITMFILFFILALFMALYQQWNLQTIANEAAAKIGQNFRYDQSLYETQVTKDMIYETRAYRYIFPKYLTYPTRKEQTEKYAESRLVKTSFAKEAVPRTVTCEIKEDTLGRRHVEVNIKGKYEVPLGEVFSYLGFTYPIEYDVTGYAECIDLIDYMNTVTCVDVFVDKVTDNTVIKLINSVIKVFNNASDASAMF